jgi:acyl dehydratase
MSTLFDNIKVGDTLPPLTLGPVNRTMLALFAGASGDHNAVHIDIDFARSAGMPDVFAHGMLSMAWLGRLLTQWADLCRHHAPGASDHLQRARGGKIRGRRRTPREG